MFFDDKSEEKVSVIIPFYNRRELLPCAIDSVLNQTYSQVELLLIDDGSTDNPENVINNYDDDRIVYKRLPMNRGACHARNKGIEYATGDYIAFLDSDNIWSDNYLEARITDIRRNNLDFSFGKFRLYDGENYGVYPDLDIDKINEKSYLKKYIYQHNVFDTNTVVIRRKCVEEIGFFDENLTRMQDWEYFGRLLNIDDVSYHFQDNVLVTGYVQKDSITRVQSYWDNRLYIFEKNYKSIKEENVLSEVMKAIYTASLAHEMDDGSKKRLYSNLKYEDIETIVQKTYEKQCELDYRIQENKKLTELLSKKVWFFEKKTLKGKKRVIVYGYGDMGHDYVHQILESDELQLVGVIDKNYSVGLNNGIHFYSIDDICNLDYDIILIAILNKKVADEVMDKLISINVEQRNIIWTNYVV